jgi:hypothetical protein
MTISAWSMQWSEIKTASRSGAPLAGSRGTLQPSFLIGQVFMPSSE